ncbi:MAG: hypothetical protein DHS20C18_45240 [Saprospiraceae bacterium]|nr:MAG: hypothetical protein DHS20C18_45240 [Saprospiraceae bacterium]
MGMKKIFTILWILICSLGAWGQVTISSESFRSGSIPFGWTQTNVTFTTSAGGYANFTMTSAILTSPIIDLSSYENVELTFDVAKFGSGTDGPLTVEISDDGGTTWTAQTFNSPTPDDSNYLTSGPTAITPTGSDVRIRFIRANSFSGKRFRDFLLEGDPVSTFDNDSDIVEGGFDEPDNIVYENYDASSALTTANAIKIGAFTIRDGGAGGSDADMVSTILTDIEFSVLNSSNLAALAIFDGINNVSEVTTVSSTTTFNSINSGTGLEAADNGTKSFDVYATFKSSVIDNEQVQLTITSATADGVNGSVFAAVNAGGALTSISGDDNRIEVTATDLIFDQEPTDVNINAVMFPFPTIAAIDANVNIDKDFSNLVSLSSTGTFSGTATTSANIVNGIATFNNLVFSVEATDRTISGTSGGVNSTGNSTLFDILDIPNIVINEILPDPASDTNGDGIFNFSDDEFVEIYNNGLISVDLAGWTIEDGVGMRHTFPANSILAPGTGVVVFGGGSPTGIPVVTQTASSGTFGLNNGGDIVSLIDDNSNVVDSYTYASSTDNVSYGRSPDFTGPFVLHTTISGNYSPGRNNANGTPLPINLLSFNAKAQDDDILLNWRTASEVNNDYMAVERSQDGREYREIGRVQGQGTTHEAQTYHFADKNPLRGVNFYRLRQVDFDGQYEYHRVVAIDFTSKLNVEEDLQVFPTAVHQLLNVRYMGTLDADVTLQIIGLDGRVWEQQALQVFKDNAFSGELDVSVLPVGIYVLRLQNGPAVVNKRFVKQ